MPWLGLAFLVFTDHDSGIAGEHMTWNLQVIWCRFIFEYAPGKIKRRAMAGAQKPALPVAGERWLRAGLKLRRWRAAKVAANADGDQKLGLDRTVLIAGILGR